MPTREQLEIIGPSGEILFYDLDPSRGVTNIGRDPENDIVIDSPGVAPFHAILDHQHKPYQIVVLSEDGGVTLRGQPLPSNVSTALQSWDALELAGYTIVLLEGEAAVERPARPGEAELPVGVGVVPPPAPAVPVTVPSAPGEPVPLPPPPIATPRLAARPPNRQDSVILTELSEQEWTLDVGQTALCDVTITNGGPIVATFEVRVEGLDPRWVVLSQLAVNLYEGAQAVVTVAITPPREPASRAGEHHLRVVVTSPEHPGRSGERGATLTINPYYEFAVGELAPRQQTISYRQRFGEAVLPIANKGNSAALFRVDAQDDEQGCSFEFQVPGETVSLARQAEMRLPPEETFAVPIQIMPRSRRLVGLRKRTYNLTVTASQPEGAQVPRSVMGQLRVKPAIGPGLIALGLLVMAILIVLIFNPSISYFKLQTPALAQAGTPVPIESAPTVMAVKAGTAVALRWDASNFANLSIDGIGKFPGGSGEVTVVPPESVKYTLKARNWLSKLPILSLGGDEEVYVTVQPVNPELSFVIKNAQGETLPNPAVISSGAQIRLSWIVTNTEVLVLTTDDTIETLDRAEYISSRSVAPDVDTLYTMTAGNRYAEEEQSWLVKVEPPAPVIEFFRVEPNRITLGETVALEWLVTGLLGTDHHVKLQAGGTPEEEVDPVDSKIYQPTAVGDVKIWLRASNGNIETRRSVSVLVEEPTPTPTGTPVPEAPIIEFFTITPDELVRGSGKAVQLAWSVTGETTDIQIGGPDFGPVSGLPALGSIPVNPDETTLYVLTAYNGELSASQTAQVKALEPTGTPLPTDTPQPTPVRPNIVFFNVTAANPDDDNKVVFKGGTPTTYEVVAGTKVNLNWLVQNAVKVTLWEDNQSLGDQPFEGVLPQTVRAEATYKLEAKNAQDDLETAFVRIERRLQVPPAPFNFSGNVITSTIRLEWDYDIQAENDIDGFRLYRADVPPGTNFRRVADEKDLTPGMRDWVDKKDLSETCGKAYYLVAVYIDFNGDRQETDASVTSWISEPCGAP